MVYICRYLENTVYYKNSQPEKVDGFHFQWTVLMFMDV